MDKVKNNQSEIDAAKARKARDQATLKQFEESRNAAKQKARLADRTAKQAEREAFRAKMQGTYELAFASNTQLDKLWDMAWDLGHAEGYESVENWYERLAELIRG